MKPTDLTAETFGAWRADPRTKAVFLFLADKRAALMDAWASGRIMPVDSQSQAQAFGDLIGLDWPDIADFYQKEVSDEE